MSADHSVDADPATSSTAPAAEAVEVTPGKVCICWTCGGIRGRPDWWPNVLPGRCKDNGRHWWVWAQVVDGRPDLATATPLGCGLGELLAAGEKARLALAARTLSAAKLQVKQLRDSAGAEPSEEGKRQAVTNMSINFAHDDSVDCTLVNVTARQFLCNDILGLLREYLSDTDFLHCRLVCSQWAAQDQQEWQMLARCIARYKREMRPAILQAYSRAAAQKVGGGLVVLGGAAIGLGTLLACLMLLRAGQVPALPLVGRFGTALAISVTGEGVEMIGQPADIPQMPRRDQLLAEETAEYQRAGQDFVAITEADLPPDELALLPLIHAKYGPEPPAGHPDPPGPPGAPQ